MRAALLLSLLLCACGGGGGAASGGPSVTVTERFTGLDAPWGLAFLPDGRALVTERPGRLRLIAADSGSSVFIAGLPAVVASGQGGLLDVALHPNFAQNRWLAFLTRKESESNDFVLSLPRRI